MVGGFLQDIIDISIPGQRINQAKALRSERQAAEDQRTRQAQALEAIRNGDVMGATGFDPTLAGQAQAVQQREAAFEQDQDTQFRDTGLRASRAIKTLLKKGVPIERAFDHVAQKAGSLFGSEEELQGIREYVVQNGPGALDSIEAAFGEQSSGKGRFISTKGGIFDTETQQIIANQDPLMDLKRREIESKIGANNALASQRQSDAENPKVAVTKGQEALDKAFAKDAVEFMQGGGSVAAANIARLENAVDQLAEDDGITGPIAGIGTVNVRTFSNPKSAAVQQQVQNAIQESLKATLGAQFARVEGEQLLDRAFAPRQQEGENIRRVKIVADTLRDALARKQEMTDYFLQNGSLTGYEGQPPDPQVFNDILRQFEEADEAEEASVDAGLETDKAARLKELRAKRDAGTLE